MDHRSCSCAALNIVLLDYSVVDILLLLLLMLVRLAMMTMITSNYRHLNDK